MKRFEIKGTSEILLTTFSLHLSKILSPFVASVLFSKHNSDAQNDERSTSTEAEEETEPLVWFSSFARTWRILSRVDKEIEGCTRAVQRWQVQSSGTDCRVTSNKRRVCYWEGSVNVYEGGLYLASIHAHEWLRKTSRVVWYTKRKIHFAHANLSHWVSWKDARLEETSRLERAPLLG